MKKAAVEGSAWRRLPIFFLLLGVCLSLSLPIKQHMGYIFSKLRLSLAAPYSFWKRIDEFRRKRVFFFACSFACVLFVLFLSTWYSFSTKRTSDMQVPLQQYRKCWKFNFSRGVCPSCGFSTQCQDRCVQSSWHDFFMWSERYGFYCAL